MSFGYRRENASIKAAIRGAFHKGIINLAAASNSGVNPRFPISFPASLRQLICVNAKKTGLRFCMDYRLLNNITIKNRYPIPMVRETLHHLSEAKFYTKLDVNAGFNKLRICITEYRDAQAVFDRTLENIGEFQKGTILKIAKGPGGILEGKWLAGPEQIPGKLLLGEASFYRPRMRSGGTGAAYYLPRSG